MSLLHTMPNSITLKCFPWLVLTCGAYTDHMYCYAPPILSQDALFIAHSPLHTLLQNLTLISTRLNSHASCLDTVLPSLHLNAAKLKHAKNPLYFEIISCNEPLMLDVCSPLCGPYRSLHHFTHPMHTLSAPYPNRHACHFY